MVWGERECGRGGGGELLCLVEGVVGRRRECY